MCTFFLLFCLKQFYHIQFYVSIIVGSIWVYQRAVCRQPLPGFFFRKGLKFLFYAQYYDTKAGAVAVFAVPEFHRIFIVEQEGAVFFYNKAFSVGKTCSVSDFCFYLTQYGTTFIFYGEGDKALQLLVLI